jgi:hypothetical protein
MTIQVLKGRMTNYRCTRQEANFIFTDDDREAMGAIAIGAALAGLSGQDIGTAAAATANEDADYLEFEIDGKPVKGWVWWSPFQEGDDVEVATEWQEDHYELFAVARPRDRVVALYPHCSRASTLHWKTVRKWWFIGSSLFVLLLLCMSELGYSGISLESRPDHRYVFFYALKFSAAFCYPVFGLMAWSLGRKWSPFARLAEKVFVAFGWNNPTNIDLVKISDETKKGNELITYGIFYFRY